MSNFWIMLHRGRPMVARADGGDIEAGGATVADAPADPNASLAQPDASAASANPIDPNTGQPLPDTLPGAKPSRASRMLRGFNKGMKSAKETFGLGSAQPIVPSYSAPQLLGLPPAPRAEGGPVSAHDPSPEYVENLRRLLLGETQAPRLSWDWFRRGR